MKGKRIKPVPWRGWKKYKNPDKRCTYPWSPGAAGYCWSFAHHVDGTKGFADLNKICPDCEMWKEKKK